MSSLDLTTLWDRQNLLVSGGLYSLILCGNPALYFNDNLGNS